MTRRPRCTPALAAALLTALATSAAVRADEQDEPKKREFPAFGKIERLDPRFDELIAPDAKLEKLAEGFEWSEGPVWVPDEEDQDFGGYVLFSDIPRNSVFKWHEKTGISLWMKPSGYTGVQPHGPEPGSNGLLLDSEGRLVLCEHGDRRVSRLEHDGGKLTLADRYQGKRLNSPNDGVFHSNGDLYFTDPPYGLRERFDDKYRELDFCGSYRLDTDGELTLLTKEMIAPNGIAFSPDEKTLYVAQSHAAEAVWKAFDVKPDGTLGDSRVFYDVTKWVGKRPGICDGLKVDQQGNVFATGPGGVYVFTPQGELLGWINTGQRTANCNWGNDGSVLYITADMYLARIKTKTKGKGF